MERQAQHKCNITGVLMNEIVIFGKHSAMKSKKFGEMDERQTNDIFVEQVMLFLIAN